MYREIALGTVFKYPCRKGAFLNHFLTVGRHGVKVCRTNITIRQFPLPPLSTRVVAAECQVPDFLIGPRDKKQRKKKVGH
jgi:hypothetical protein